VLDYAQESSRARRDRLLSEVIIIVQDSDQRAAKDSQDKAEQVLVRLYIGESSAAQCRRVVLDGYLDRREVERLGCEEEEEGCNVCRGEEAEEDSKQPSDSEQPSDSKEIAGEIDRESEREEMQRTFEQQQRKQHSPH
jgi:superfamily II DNA helicase RecQ